MVASEPVVLEFELLSSSPIDWSRKCTKRVCIRRTLNCGRTESRTVAEAAWLPGPVGRAPENHSETFRQAANRMCRG